MPARQICSYTGPDGFDPVMDFIGQLEPKVQAKIHIQLGYLQNAEYALQPPLVKAFRLERYKGLYELRTRIQQMVRILFYIDTHGGIVLLHGFVKRHARATEQALETARARKQALVSGAAGTKSIM